jgi:hypothetical protein
MRIARNAAISNNAHGRYLPPSWRTLAVLAALDPDDIEAAIADGRIHPEVERKDAVALVRRRCVPVIEASAELREVLATTHAAHAASVAGIIEVGRLLLEAKADCSHGEWGELTGRTTGKSLLPFSWRTAHMLMRIAENRALSNVHHGAHLPSSWRNLAVLSALDPDDIEACRFAWSCRTEGRETRRVIG